MNTTNTIYVGADNGSSGSIAIIYPDSSKIPTFWARTPVLKKCRNYQKAEKYLTRINCPELIKLLKERVLAYTQYPANIFLERPYTNITRFGTSLLSARAFEATLIALEVCEILSYTIVDSKQWQSVMIPGVKSSELLKKEGLAIGRKLFPTVKFSKDADSLLMALWALNKGL